MRLTFSSTLYSAICYAPLCSLMVSSVRSFFPSAFRFPARSGFIAYGSCRPPFWKKHACRNALSQVIPLSSSFRKHPRTSRANPSQNPRNIRANSAQIPRKSRAHSAQIPGKFCEFRVNPAQLPRKFRVNSAQVPCKFCSNSAQISRKRRAKSA